MADLLDGARPASTPNVGAVRDAVRTTLAFGIAWALTKIVGAEMATQMSGAVEGVVVVAVSALFAWLGKVFRNKDSVAGQVI